MGKISDESKVIDLLERIGKERNWSDKDIENDLLIIKRNRLKTVNDLRALSTESWAKIELLPLVKDLLRSAVNPDNQTLEKSDKKEQKKEKKEEKKKEKKKDNKDDKKKDNKKEEKKKDKKKIKKGENRFELGEPVVPIIFNDSPLPTDLIEDPLTIQNTIKNGIAPELSILDVSTTDEEDEPTSPSDAPVRRKSVTFSSEEPFIGTAASEGKKKKEKKKSNTMASTNIGHHKRPYTHLVKNLPSAPVTDTFLQTLHDKLIANLPQ